MTNSNNNTSIVTTFDDLIKIKSGGIPKGKYIIVGKSRQTGKSYFSLEYQKRMVQNWKKYNRQIKIKTILNNIK